MTLPPLQNFVDFQPPVVGANWLNAIDRKVREVVSVKDFGAVGNGLADDTSAFTAARTATGGRYFIPAGTYVVNASPDVWADPFFAGPNTALVIGGISYNISNAFLGPLRYVTVNNMLYGIVHAKTSNTIQLWQDGTPGTATYFYRAVAFSTDSHFIQARPATNGGSTDLLLQRSDVHPTDPSGNRFNFTFRESLDNWAFQMATTASGFPNFDSFMEVDAGTSFAMRFPAVRPQFNLGWSVKQRAAGGFEMTLEPTSSTVTRLRQVGGSATEFMRFGDNSLGFFGAAGGARPTVTGSRGGNAALASLLSSLAALGLITDSTT